jgi:hypothetical protein
MGEDERFGCARQLGIAAVKAIPGGNSVRWERSFRERIRDDAAESDNGDRQEKARAYSVYAEVSAEHRQQPGQHGSAEDDD